MWSLGRSDTPSDEPLLIVDDRVTGATDDVLSAGVTLGMPRREAEAMAPFATVMKRDLGEEIRRFEPIVKVVENLVPKVEVVAPGLLFVPVAGAVKYYGSEEQLAVTIEGGRPPSNPPTTIQRGQPPSNPPTTIDLQSGLGGIQQAVGGSARQGYEFLLGIADGPFAARWAAATAKPGEPHIVADTINFLSQLDLGTLRESMGGTEMIDTFRWLGITTLGDIVRLPRDTLASRFGNHGILAHRLASGEDRSVDPRDIPAELSVESTFEDPLESLDAVMFAGHNLVKKLLVGLRATGVAPHSVEIAATPAGGKTKSRVWRSADPFTEHALYDRVRWQLTAWVENSRCSRWCGRSSYLTG